MNKKRSIVICNFRFVVFYSFIIFILSTGCSDIVNQPMITGRQVEMVLVSNVPNTTFRYRMQVIDAAPEEGWENIGTGQKVAAYLYEGGRYEIEAKPLGYDGKRIKFTEPIERYDFQFLAADKQPNFEENKLLPNNDIEEPKVAESLETNIPVKKTTPMSLPGISKKWAITIGVSEYQQRGKWGLENLYYASKDAAAIAEYLQSPQGGQFDHVQILTDQKATIKSIKIALRENLRSIQRNDIVLIFWAGHGVPDPHEPDKLYLLGYDSDPEHMASTAYAMSEFKNDIQNLNARQIILIADACHSAGLSDPTQFIRGNTENKIVDSLRGVTIGPAPNVIGSSVDGSVETIDYSNLIFTSCEAGERSLESSLLDGGHGVFTYFILDGLRGAADRPDNNGNADGKVSLGEMVDYATDRVKRFSQNQQHPDTGGRFNRNLTMGVVK